MQGQPSHSKGLVSIFLLIIIGVAVLIGYWGGQRSTIPQREGSEPSSITTQGPAGDSLGTGAPAPAGAPSDASASAAAGSVPKADSSSARIPASSLSEFVPYAYPGGKPFFEGESISAYVSVPSTKQRVVLAVNQMGEYPRIKIGAKESVEVRLQFANSRPGSKVAIAAQDGGRLHQGQPSAALTLDADRQVAFGFTSSANEGVHRIHVATPSGETRILDFWVGPDLVMATQ